MRTLLGREFLAVGSSLSSLLIYHATPFWSAEFLLRNQLIFLGKFPCMLFVVFPHTRNFKGASLVAQTVKNLPAMQEIRVQSLHWEDPLEKEVATHSSILAWRIHGQRSLMGCSSWGHKESDTTEWLTLRKFKTTLGKTLFEGLNFSYTVLEI